MTEVGLTEFIYIVVLGAIGYLSLVVQFACCLQHGRYCQAYIAIISRVMIIAPVCAFGTLGGYGAATKLIAQSAVVSKSDTGNAPMTHILFKVAEGVITAVTVSAAMQGAIELS